MGYRRFILAGSAALAITVASPTLAQESAVRDYNIAAQELKYSLRDLAREAGLELIAPSETLADRTAPVLRGRYTVREALRHLLRGSGLTADISEGTILVRGRSTAPLTAAADQAGGGEILVTGTRIKGTSPASPVTTISREKMKDAGQSTLADVIRTIPQNFGGGQNAGIGLNVPETRGLSAGSSSTLNLRGLGSDATLTLLNGHRLAYNVANQSVDISTIPVVAIERLEIVADGASALYGSDAVGGVANIILRRDYEGLLTTARIGGSTDGGNFQQQYSALAGTKWGTGGAVLAYEFGRDTEVRASDRSYAADKAPTLFLYPAIKHHNLIGSAHQDLSETLSFEIDGLFNTRSSRTQYALDARGDISANGVRTAYKSKAFAVAPALRAALGSTWDGSLIATYGQDHSRYDLGLFAGGSRIYNQVGCYCNSAASVEANATGELIDLPAGAIKVALGAGWRANWFHGFQTAGGTQNIKVSQDTYFAFGEVNVPLIAPEQELAWAHRMTITAAARWEDYPGIDRVLTPKIGLIFSPSEDFDFKASWAKSFKAPTLFQRYNVTFATVYSAASRGGAGYPPGSTAILLSGGNPDLEPERAATFSATAAFHPRSIEGVRFELSYFSVDYTNRIVTPIPFPSQSLSNPQYRDLVDLSPTAAQLAAITSGNVLFQNTTGAPYNPASVVAVIRNNNRNAAAQRVRGVDASASYDIDFNNGGSLSVQANASYIRLSQRLSDLQPSVRLGGTIFNVPHWRGRGGATWKQDGVTLAGFLNYTGSVRDVRFAPVTRVRAMTTFDIAGGYQASGAAGILANLEIQLAAQNLFNRHPGRIRSSLPYDTPYDSTNATPFGRVVSLSVTKKW